MKNLEVPKGIKISEMERAYDKIPAWFFAYPEDEFTLNELCKELEISKTTANTIITKLEKYGFLEKRVIGKLWRIKVNQKHPYNITRKIPFNLKHVYESGILEWISQNIPSTRATILFGSYRKGDDTDKSDIDIAIEVLGDKKLEIRTTKIEKFGYRRNIKVNIHLFSRKNIDINLFANIANGIVLEGFLEAKP